MKAQIDLLRKRLHYRSWHRGSREMDLLLGRFADAVLEDLDADALVALDRLLLCEDPDIYDWVMGAAPIPDGQPEALLLRIRAFAFSESEGT